MTDKRNQRKNENEYARITKEHKIQTMGMNEIRDRSICLADTVKDDELIVPVSALSLFVEDPIKANRRFVSGINPAPTPGLISGQLEHSARKYVFDELRKIYLEAEQADDLRISYDALMRSVERATMECEHRFSFLSLNIEVTASELLNRLRMEEDARVAAAGNLMMDGIKGFDLVCLLFPLAAEFEIRSQNLGLVGRIDAIHSINFSRYPLDYKTESRMDWIIRESEKIQMAAYCMLIEDYYDTPCDYAEIYYTRYFHSVPIFMNRVLKDRVLEIRRMFIENSVVEEIPMGVLT